MYQSSQSIQSRYNEKHLWPKGHSLFPQLLASLSYQPGDKTHLRLHHHGRKKTIIRFGALQEFAALTQALYRLVHSSSTDASCSFVSLSVRMRDLILGWYALDVYIYIYDIAVGGTCLFGTGFSKHLMLAMLAMPFGSTSKVEDSRIKPQWFTAIQDS